MASPNILPHDNEQGFTLIEVMIAMVIMVALFSLGLLIMFDFYRSLAVHSEQGMIVSVFQKARNQSMNNIDQTRHGVHIQINPLQYTVFECPAGSPQCTSYTASSSDYTIAASYKAVMTHPTTDFDIIFEQLSGSCVPTATFDCNPTSLITLTQGSKAYNITINSEGQINW